MKPFLCVSLIVFFTVTAHGQKEELPKHFTYKGKIVRNYDRFKNIGSYVLTGVDVFKQGDLTIQLVASAGFEGDAPKTAPKVIIFGLAIITKRPVRARDPELLALVDGKPTTLGELKLIDSNSLAFLYGATYVTVMPFNDLSKLMLADKLEMKFDGVEFELMKEHRHAVLDLLNYSMGVWDKTDK